MRAPKRRGSKLAMEMSAAPCTIHCARYLPAPGPQAMPTCEPQHSQKFRSPEGPSSMLPSGGWVMAPCTIRLMPSSAKTGMRSMAFSSHGMMRS